MRIVALSDNHGWLPDKMPEGDVLVLAGDILPLDIQRDNECSFRWARNRFAKWIHKWKYSATIVVPGNHDFCFEKGDPFAMFDDIFTLVGQTQVINRVKFYGFPYIRAMRNWAFPDNAEVYDNMKSADVLVCHDTPSIKGAFSDKDILRFAAYNIVPGNARLADKVKDYKLTICGHWHEACKGPLEYDGGVQYNVSVKDNHYKVKWKPTVIEI